MQQTENLRINSLKKYDILDTPPDGAFDKITALAAKIFNVPIALITIVDTDRIWFKSQFGIDVKQIDKHPGLCASAILSDELYLVEDAKKDPRCLANPLVAGEFGLEFYAAVPLKTRDGYNLGNFVIIDKKKRHLNEDQKEMLSMLADIVMEEMEIRLEARNLFKKKHTRVISPS